MSAYVREKELSNGTTVIQVEFKDGRRRVGLKHVGTAHNEVELKLLRDEAQKIKLGGQLYFDFAKPKESVAKLLRAYSQTLWDALEGEYDKLGFGHLDDKIFRQLVLARIIEPASKLDTIRILDGLGLDSPSNTAIHRCLKRVAYNQYREIVSSICFRYCHPDSLAVVLYDVTTLYFEIDREDEYRIPGYSKERRLDPQIALGLLVNSEGYPLEIQSFEGNKGEVKTIIPVLNSFRQRHGLIDITVAADAAMLSAKNIAELEVLGYNYIIGSKLDKTPYGIEISLKEGVELTDGQIIEAPKSITLNGRHVNRREIFQYKKKRAARDLKNIDKTLGKAQRIVSGEVPLKNNRFLKITADKREIHTEILEEAKKRAGVKGYLTNLDIPPQQVIDYYHQLHHVEKSFRMSKSDLKARPVFHHERDSIEAHLTIVLTALALSRHIEAKSGLSIRKFVNTLEPIKTGVIMIGKQIMPAEPNITDKIATLLQKLRNT